MNGGATPEGPRKRKRLLPIHGKCFVRQLWFGNKIWEIKQGMYLEAGRASVGNLHKTFDENKEIVHVRK